MGNYTSSILLTAFLGGKFPGGLQKFIKDGGLISPTPEENLYLIYHPDPPESFLKEVDTFNELGKIVIKLINNLNFEQDNTEDVKNQLDALAEQISKDTGVSGMLFSANSLLFVVTIPEMVDSSTVQLIADTLLDNMVGIIRGYVITAEEIFPFERDVSLDETHIPVTDVEQSCTITDDAITDLKILLSQECDVNDIINSL